MSEEGYSTYEIRVRAVDAVQRGWPVSHTADMYGVSRRTLHRWLARYEGDGHDGLQRKEGSGRPRKLEELTEDDWRAIVLQPASAFGFETDLWTVGRLHGVIHDLYDVAVSRDTVWRRLRDAGLTYQKPEREYYEIDEEAREEWRRVSSVLWPAVVAGMAGGFREGSMAARRCGGDYPERLSAA